MDLHGSFLNGVAEYETNKYLKSIPKPFVQEIEELLQAQKLEYRRDKLLGSYAWTFRLV